MKLESKVALVTGGAQGIGLACASRFADEGAKVAIVDVDAARGAEAVAAIGAERALFVAGDVAKAETVSRAVAATLERFGAIDVLLNNAGITHAADFLELAEADFDRVLGVNLKSYFLFGQAVAKWMVGAKRGGTIVNMSSVNAVIAIPNQVPYCVSKGGVAQLTKVMAISLAPKGIRVNIVSPGPVFFEGGNWDTIKTHMTAFYDATVAKMPLKRLGDPREIANAIAFLASPAASLITGANLVIDGGYTKRIKF